VRRKFSEVRVKPWAKLTGVRNSVGDLGMKVVEITKATVATVIQTVRWSEIFEV
jgi:hypothetical protein